MKNKRVILVTALLLIASLCVTVCAAETTVIQNGGSGSADVYVTKTSAASASTVYSVEITWGSMEFTYKTNDTQRWDPEQLKYVVDSGEDEWVCEGGADMITVANRSNAEITAGFGYTAEENSGVSAAFADYSSGTALTDDKVTLEAPVVSTDDQNPTVAPSTDVRIKLSGTPNIAENTKTKVGSVTVTITGNASADSGTSSEETTTGETVVAGVEAGATSQGIAIFTTDIKNVYSTVDFETDAYINKFVVNPKNPITINSVAYWVVEYKELDDTGFVEKEFVEVTLTDDSSTEASSLFSVEEVQIRLEINLDTMTMKVYNTNYTSDE